jgi:hypothetical protein
LTVASDRIIKRSDAGKHHDIVITVARLVR